MCPFSILAFLQPTTVDKEPKGVASQMNGMPVVSKKTSTFVLVLFYKLLIKVSLRQL